MSRRVYNISHDNPGAIAQEMMVSFAIPPIGEYVEVAPVIPPNTTFEMVEGIQKAFYHNLNILVERSGGRLSFTPPNEEAKESVTLIELLQRQNMELKERLQKLEKDLEKSNRKQELEMSQEQTVNASKPRKRKVTNG